MTVGNRIKQSREKADLSQVELAKKIGVSKQTLYKYENDIITNIPSDKLQGIADTLKISPAYLMGWEDNMSNENSDIVADFLPDLFSNEKMLECIKKLYDLSKEHQQTIFDTVAYWYEKEGH